MAQSRGIRANHIGMNRWNIAAASRRADRTSACIVIGRMWNTEDRFSSCANAAAMILRYLPDFFRPRTAMIASTWTRKSTSSALGGGNSDERGVGSGMSRLHGCNADRKLNAHGYKPSNSFEPDQVPASAASHRGGV